MKICGHEYKTVIGFVEGLKRENDKMYFGHIKFSTGMIHLWPRARRSIQEESLIHEIVHAIIFHSNCKGDHDESLLQAIAGGLYQLGIGKFLWEKARPERISDERTK